MSTYKVIQDIEAEDKLVGPLSFRQFIYGLIAAFLFYICFICLTKGIAFGLIFFLPPALFCTFFAFPFMQDQPTEIWALAKIRFYFKPRKRVWNQSGVKELVTITVPKRVEIRRTDGLSQLEVKSRLKALADTIDSRGWAIKNVAANAYVRPGMINPGDTGDRLLSITSMPQPVPDYDVADSNDILDDQSSPLAQQFTDMIQTSTTKHRQKLLEDLSEQRAAKADKQPKTQWFARKAAATQGPVAAAPQQPQQTTTDEDAALSASLKERLASQAQTHLHPLQAASPEPTATVSEPVTQPAASSQNSSDGGP